MRAMLKETARRVGRFRRSERGTQLVELALVLPILLSFFAATAEFGRYFYNYSTLTKATRAGARALATTPVKTSGATVVPNPCMDEKVKRLVVYGDANAVDGGATRPVVPGLTTANVQLLRAGAVASVPDTVTVKIVNYNYAPLIDLGKFSNSLKWTSVPLKPSTTMRYLLTQPSPGACS